MKLGHRREFLKLTFPFVSVRKDALEMPDVQYASFRNGGQFTLSTQLVKPNQLAKCSAGIEETRRRDGFTYSVR